MSINSEKKPSGGGRKTVTQRKILIVDDHPLFREGLSQYINKERDLTVCGEAGNAEEAMRKVDETDPDLIIMDISLQTSSGLDLSKAILARNHKKLILVLSMHDESLHAERALRAGARGYVMKQEASSAVMTAIRDMLNGKIYVSDSMKNKMLERKVQGVSQEEASISLLSDRELEVFRLIGRGVTTSEIAKNLHLSVKTIETYRANIKTKLGLKNNTELIRHAVESLHNEHKT